MTVDLTQDVYLNYTIIEGLRYVESIINTAPKLCNEHHTGLLSKKGEPVGKIWIAEDHRGVRFVKFCPADVSLAGPSWWRTISTPCDVDKITINSDVSAICKSSSILTSGQGLKARDILIYNETIPYNASNYVGWVSPERPNDVIDVTTLDQVNFLPKRVMMTFFNCNTNGITGYTVVTDGSPFGTIHAHEDGSTGFYADMDAAFPRGFFIYMPLDKENM